MRSVSVKVANKYLLPILCGILLAAFGCQQVSKSHDPAQPPQHAKKEVPPATAQEIELLQKILHGRPNDSAALFNLALDEASIGQRETAIDLLRQMANAHAGLDPREPAGRPFKDFVADPRFVSLVAQIEKENPPVIRSEPAFVIHERDLAPEGIAYDPVDKSFYISSVTKSKIVRITADGEAEDFKQSGQDGLGLTLGMKVDAPRRLLWVVSIPAHLETGQSTSGVFQYDLRTGALRFKHQLPPGSAGFLNDVALRSSGEAFATNTGTGEVFRMSSDHDGIELLLPANSVPQANGISLSSDERVLFVGGWIGIARIDLATKQFQLLRKADNISDAGLDGMYFYKQSLIGIQNPDLHPGRVMRYFLNPAMDTITRAEILESYNPRFDIPTTGTLVRDSLYFMANTQIEKREQSGSSPAREPWQEIQVVKLKL
jgi:hypothetical protein